MATKLSNEEITYAAVRQALPAIERVNQTFGYAFAHVTVDCEGRGKHAKLVATGRAIDGQPRVEIAVGERHIDSVAQAVEELKYAWETTARYYFQLSDDERAKAVEEFGWQLPELDEKTSSQDDLSGAQAKPEQPKQAGPLTTANPATKTNADGLGLHNEILTSEVPDEPQSDQDNA